MRNKQILIGIALLCLILGSLAVAGYTHQRMAECKYIPLLAEELLPNADLAQQAATAPLPVGWAAGAPGVEVAQFAVDGDRRALQLLGIANYIQPPTISVEPGQRYCFQALAISDDHDGVAPRLRVTFHWHDEAGALQAENHSAWQPVVLWQPENPPDQWAPIQAAFRAPPATTQLTIQIQPSSDERIYLDAFHLRHGGTPPPVTSLASSSEPTAAETITILPFPDGKHGAVSFSFDWETAMGGLIHSRSVGDPYSDQDPITRGLRMREGITTTLELFQPHGIRATYYATGYNFLDGNTSRTLFMDNPTYTWANTANRWTSNRWQTTPWFAPDPYGTVASHPAWYFGDLVPQLLAAEQDIQSHTFSHFYAGFVGPTDWQNDINAWNDVATHQDVAPFTSLAFPWSSSAGMSEANWQLLTAAGVTSVTRLSDQSQYNLFPLDEQGLVREPFCRPLPGHEQILACPDFYLTPETAEQARRQLDAVLEQGGVIDLWAHTEEVITPEQRRAWQHVVDYAVAQPDLWIAPLREITAWQQALQTVEAERISQNEQPDEPVVFRVTNPPPGLTLRLPFVPERVWLKAAANQHSPHTAPPRYNVQDDIVIINQVYGGYEVYIEAWPET